ncbi:hypothetical protein WJX72_003739 [[Myrmecia] bisecta]|uniref:Uncharacterized protein n=1 Tax=[Myrmecia] bisecta TaxID=41462 RepID=A0AAW1R5J6_9CHLO
MKLYALVLLLLAAQSCWSLRLVKPSNQTRRTLRSMPQPAEQHHSSALGGFKRVAQREGVPEVTAKDLLLRFESARDQLDQEPETGGSSPVRCCLGRSG